jgi:biotin operon repressor
MANTQLDMRKIKQIFRLYTEGVSKREISKRLGVSRNTVKKYIQLLSGSGFTSEELNNLLLEDLRLLISPAEEIDNTRHKYLYDLFPEVSKKLKKVGNTRFLIWESYLADYPDLISYSRFCHFGATGKQGRGGQNHPGQAPAGGLCL